MHTARPLLHTQHHVSEAQTELLLSLEIPSSCLFGRHIAESEAVTSKKITAIFVASADIFNLSKGN